jgi:pimeloyl-ACP methyl ester carboxylesterase
LRFNQVRPAIALALALLLSACATAPVTDYTVEVPAGVTDGRARFAEIFCSVLKERGDTLPDHRPCEDALSHVADSPQGSGKPVDLGQSQRHLVVAMVPGIGYACIAPWLQPPTTARENLEKSGYALRLIDVDALSGTAKNAGQVRAAIMAMPNEAGPTRIVLFGYSKGTPDVLEAVVRYPELQQRVAAVVSIAGAVGGSPLANDAKQGQADLLRHWPKARCDSGDGGAVESLRPEVRKMWLAQNPLPAAIRYYSVVTLPDPGRISNIVEPTYRKLAKIDPRNDSQVIYSDQIIPGSTLVGFLNADHWAVNVPIGRAHAVIGSTLVNHNDYPREALLEALLRYVEEDLSARAN